MNTIHYIFKAAKYVQNKDHKKMKLHFILYAFFWVIPRRLNFIWQRFGTLCSTFIGG